MSASDEWQDWHLTPRGWESGSHREDGAGITDINPPADRVVTSRFREYLGSIYGSMKRYSDETWRSDDEAVIKELLTKFGPPPERL